MKFKENILIKKNSNMFYRKIQNFILPFAFYFFRIIKINNKKIFIENYQGLNYFDNGKYIVEEIIRRNINCQIIWAINEKQDNNFPPSVNIIPSNTFRYIFHMSTSKIWIDNCRKQHYVRKRKKQFYFQTWHGGISLKKIEKDAENKLTWNYIERAKNDSKMIDGFISHSSYFTNLIRKSFWYTGRILEIGYPRHDLFFQTNRHDDIKNKVRKYFSIKNECKLILYCPTFRNSHDISLYSLNYEKLIYTFKDKFDSDIKILIRLHPNMIEKSKELEYTNNILNASIYSDLQELLISCDAMITDYSSTMFEFALLNKPIFLYMPDIEEYGRERDFRIDINSLTSYSKNFDELIYNIKTFNLENYTANMKKKITKLGIVKKGTASKKIVDEIEKILGE